MKIEEKSKRKRSVSVLTVFIWLAMIVVMTTITINGIKENHAIEGDNSILRIKVKVSGLDTEEVRKRYESLDIKVIDSIYSINPVELLKFDFVNQDSEGNYIYEINRDELENKLSENNIKYGYYIKLAKENIEGYAQIITSENLREASNEIYSSYISIGSDIDYNVDIQYVEEAKIKINLKIDGIEDEEIKESIYEKVGVIYLADLYYDSNRYIENGNEIIEYSKIVPGIEGAIYTSSSLIRAVRVNEYNAMVAYEINEEKYY
ncbi:MAG: hypothetical protein Q4D02_08235, partial [Clostridia bacterium]|nr:hypothetical protein [Clostridia bacterium]